MATVASPQMEEKKLMMSSNERSNRSKVHERERETRPLIVRDTLLLRVREREESRRSKVREKRTRPSGPF